MIPGLLVLQPNLCFTIAEFYEQLPFVTALYSTNVEFYLKINCALRPHVFYDQITGAKVGHKTQVLMFNCVQIDFVIYFHELHPAAFIGNLRHDNKSEFLL